ncbi:MarR family transcriptional regulator [archaeon]|nr:MarR family transcriptional regulator [archaeon]PJC45345.1 MAG: hypothetical protein CO037_02000 [Candidatus Pacearchaeota archaeon CG_4_9_14_0_2_um_filter_30_8]
MENKKLGLILIVIGILVGGLFVYYSGVLSEKAVDKGCFQNIDCTEINQESSISHFAIGVFSFLIALGFYILFFNKTEEKIIERLEKNVRENIEKEKFDFALKMLNPFEARVLKKTKEQEGITQNTLRFKVDMSKAKLSYVLQDLEKRGLIKRVKKGKTFEVYTKL